MDKLSKKISGDKKKGPFLFKRNDNSFKFLVWYHTVRTLTIPNFPPAVPIVQVERIRII